MMRLSVIVPVRNGADFVAELLDSLEAQSTLALEGCEFIAVDDASTDTTAAILAERPWLRVLRHERRQGAGAARNTGARAAHGDILVFLDADTRVRQSDFLLRCAAFFEQHPEYAAVSGCYHRRNPGPRLFGRYLDVSEAAMHEGALDRPARATLNGCVCVVRKAAFQDVGGFSEDPRVVLEDPDLGCRLSAAGYLLWFSGDLRVEHRQPGLRHYVKELVPRTRDYLRLIRQYGAYNEAMGGRREGVCRLLFVLGALLLSGAPASPPAGGLGALLLGAAGWQGRAWLRCVLEQEGVLFLPAALLFHFVTSTALIAGAGLGVLDRVRLGVRRGLVDASVVVAYLKSLLTPGAPGQLIHFLTHRCNAHCAHCFDGPQRQRVAQEDELDLARIQRLAATAGPLGHVSLTGGEPLLRDDIAEIVAAYYRVGVRSFSLNSNGSCPERLAALVPRLAAAAPLGRVIVTISVDGLEEDHDRLRGVPGLFRKVEKSLDLLCRARPQVPQLRVHACITLSQANVGEVDAVIARLRPLGLDQIEFSRLRGAPADPALRGVDDASYRAACARLAATAPAKGLLARMFAGLDRAMSSVVQQADTAWPWGPCLAGRRLAVVQADGTVLPCEMLRTVRAEDAAAYDGFTLGRLDAYDFHLGALLADAQTRRVTGYIRDSACRCSFECAIFATMAYRPWRLIRFPGCRRR